MSMDSPPRTQLNVIAPVAHVQLESVATTCRVPSSL